MKRKVLVTLMSLVLSTSLIACGSESASSNKSADIEDLQERIEELEEENEELKESLAKYENQSENESETSTELTLSASINETNAEDWGLCGENLMWYYKNDILVIRGTGAMTDFGWGGAPWYELNPVKVIIEEGCTHIGGFAFDPESEGDYKVSYLSSIVIPDSVTSIGDYAFYDTSNLNSITLRGETYTHDEFKDALINNGISYYELPTGNAQSNVPSNVPSNAPTSE